MFARIACGVALTEILMRKVLLLAVGLVLVGTSAWSQSSRDDDGDRRDHWHDDHDGWDGDRDDRRRRAMRDHDDDDDRPGRNARFFVRSGDTQLRVVCGDRESTQTCVDAALRVFDRVQAQPRTATSAPTSPQP